MILFQQQAVSLKFLKKNYELMRDPDSRMKNGSRSVDNRLTTLCTF